MVTELRRKLGQQLGRAAEDVGADQRRYVGSQGQLGALGKVARRAARPVAGSQGGGDPLEGAALAKRYLRQRAYPCSSVAAARAVGNGFRKPDRLGTGALSAYAPVPQGNKGAPLGRGRYRCSGLACSSWSASSTAQPTRSISWPEK